MASDSNEISANKGLPVTLSDSDFGESDRVEMHHQASAQSSLGLSSQRVRLFLYYVLLTSMDTKVSRGP